MRIGIIGAGAIGTAFARRLVAAGHEALLSNSRGPETLTQLVADLGPGAIAATRDEAAQAEIVVLAVPHPQAAKALAGLPDWNGRVLVDATNDFSARPALGQPTSSEQIAALAPSAHDQSPQPPRRGCPRSRAPDRRRKSCAVRLGRRRSRQEDVERRAHQPRLRADRSWPPRRRRKAAPTRRAARQHRPRPAGGESMNGLVLTAPPAVPASRRWRPMVRLRRGSYGHFLTTGAIVRPAPDEAAVGRLT